MFGVDINTILLAAVVVQLQRLIPLLRVSTNLLPAIARKLGVEPEPSDGIPVSKATPFETAKTPVCVPRTRKHSI